MPPAEKNPPTVMHFDGGTLLKCLQAYPLKPIDLLLTGGPSIAAVRNRLTIITLDEMEYYATIEQLAEKRITGGRIYDALLLRCALKVKAETIFTHGTFKHFDASILTPFLEK